MNGGEGGWGGGGGGIDRIEGPIISHHISIYELSQLFCVT